jgi:hypothetical protein
MPPTTQLGGKLGPRLAELALKGFIEAQRRGADTKVRTGLVLQDQFFRIVGGELANSIGAIWREALDQVEDDNTVKPLLDFLANGRGQAQAIMGMLSTAQGLAQGFGGLISNRLANVVQADFANHPHAVLEPGIAAALTARHIVADSTGDGEAHRSAINSTRFAWLVEAAKSWPDVGALLELRRRGAIDSLEATSSLLRQGYTPHMAGKLLSLDRVLLDVAAIASMVVRGVVSQDTGRAKAATIGYAASDFDLLVKATGNPPGPMDLLTAYRRGIISRSRLEHGIRQGDLKNEWIDVIEALRYEPLSPAGAVEAAVEGHLTQSEAKRLWTVGGMDPGDFDTAYQTAGSPPGVQQMLELWQRGAITESQVNQAIRESRLKPKYTEIVKRLARRLPPMDNIRMMVRDGAITPAQGVSKLMDLGYNHEDAAGLIKQAQAQKHAVERDLTKAEIVELYLLRGISAAQARSSLDGLGYDAAEITLILKLADLKRQRADQNAAASVVRSKFVARRIDSGEAGNLLDRAGVPADQRDHLITLWSIERDANVALITPAQAVAAFKKGVITQDELTNVLTAHGYDPWNRTVLLRLAGANV